MSRPIDEMIVKLSLENKDFEKNAEQSIRTFDKMTNEFQKSDGVNMSGLEKGIASINKQFSLLGIAALKAKEMIVGVAFKGITAAFSNMTRGMRDGFHEYELQMKSIQTIMSNTMEEFSKKQRQNGTQLKTVNSYLNELNTYADKTIYSFSDMTRNIGLFTAAGVKLKDSVTAIKGMSNLAASVGADNTHLSTAMYQMSQALATGQVKLMDWNSVVNAGMGGKVFQKALQDTAKEAGVTTKAFKQLEKGQLSFRDSISGKQGSWISARIMIDTLKKFQVSSEDVVKAQNKMTEAQKKYGKSSKEAQKAGENYKKLKQYYEQYGKTMGEAATKIRTFSQLIDTVGEEIGSGWTQTWQLIIGDFSESSKLFTKIGNVVTGTVNKMSTFRNSVLQTWHDAGGYKDLWAGLGNIAKSVGNVFKGAVEPFRKLIPMPKQLGQSLASATKSFKKFTEGMLAGSKPVGKILGSFNKMVAKALTDLGGTFSKVKDAFFSSFKGAGSGIVGALNVVANGFGAFSDAVCKGMDSAAKFVSDGFNKIAKSASKSSGNNGFIGKIKSTLTSAMKWVRDNFSIGKVLQMLQSAAVTTFLLQARKLLTSFSDIFAQLGDTLHSMFGVKENVEEEVGGFKRVLNEVGNALESFSKGVSVGTVVAIAGSVYMLANAIKTLSKIKIDSMATSFITVFGLFKVLENAFSKFSTIMDGFKSKGVIKNSIAMMAMAKSVQMLSDAMLTLSKLSIDEIAQGLITLVVCMKMLTSSLSKLSGGKLGLSTSISMIAMAKAVQMLGTALSQFGSMSFDQIIKGLAGMGGALAEFSITMTVMSKVGGLRTLAGSVSLVIAAKSLLNIGKALKELSTLSWDGIAKGLVGLGGALSELALVTGALSMFGALDVGATTTSIVAMVNSLGKISDVLQEIGSLSWDQVAIGLVGMGGALAELSTVVAILGKSGIKAGMSSLLGASAIVMAAKSLENIANALIQLGSLSWNQIAVGLVGMGGALAELATAVGVLGKLAGLSSIIGAIAIDAVTHGLQRIAQSLMTIGSMSWSGVTKGLVGMGGALAIIAASAGVLGSVAGLAGIIGAGAIVLVADGLGDIADALQKLGGMSWDEIGRSLTAMMGALSELAAGSLINVLSGLAAGGIKSSAMALNVLADSMKKWKNVTVPANLGSQLSSLASGVLKFTFGGWGSSSIKTLAAPLGTLAVSVSKWKNVTVPANIGASLGSLASGVLKFTLGGLGAGTIATVAGPLGTMANSVKKWNGVTVPANIGASLSALANGVKSFTFAFLGGASLSMVAGPLGELAKSVKKWNGVTVPKNISATLKGLANGVKSFSFAFLGGMSLDMVTGPLGNLANSVKKWNGISVPKNIGTQLHNLASGVKAFSFAFLGGFSLSTITGPLGSLATSVKKWNGVSISKSLGTQLKSLASAIKAFNGTKVSAGTANDISKIATAMKKLGTASYKSAASGIKSVGSSLKSLSSSAKSISGLGTKISSNVVKPIQSMAGKIKGAGSKVASAVKSIVNAGAKVAHAGSTYRNAGSSNANAYVSGVRSKTGAASSAGRAIAHAFSNGVKSAKTRNAGVTAATGFVNGVNGKRGASKTAGTAIGNAAKAGMTSSSNGARSVGAHFASGYAAGVRSGTGAAAAAARSLGASTLSALKKKLAVHSPSRKTRWIGKMFDTGYVKGIINNVRPAIRASVKMGSETLKALNKELDIHSPSKKTAKTGKNLAKGLAKGIGKNQKSVNKAVRQSAKATSKQYKKQFAKTTSKAVKSAKSETKATSTVINKRKALNKQLTKQNAILKKQLELQKKYAEQVKALKKQPQNYVNKKKLKNAETNYSRESKQANTTKKHIADIKKQLSSLNKNTKTSTKFTRNYASNTTKVVKDLAKSIKTGGLDIKDSRGVSLFGKSVRNAVSAAGVVKNITKQMKATKKGTVGYSISQVEKASKLAQINKDLQNENKKIAKQAKNTSDRSKQQKLWEKYYSNKSQISENKKSISSANKNAKNNSKNFNIQQKAMYSLYSANRTVADRTAETLRAQRNYNSLTSRKTKKNQKEIDKITKRINALTKKNEKLRDDNSKLTEKNSKISGKNASNAKKANNNTKKNNSSQVKKNNKELKELKARLKKLSKNSVSAKDVASSKQALKDAQKAQRAAEAARNKTSARVTYVLKASTLHIAENSKWKNEDAGDIAREDNTQQRIHNSMNSFIEGSKKVMRSHGVRTSIADSVASAFEQQINSKDGNMAKIEKILTDIRKKRDQISRNESRLKQLDSEIADSSKHGTSEYIDQLKEERDKLSETNENAKNDLETLKNDYDSAYGSLESSAQQHYANAAAAQSDRDEYARQRDEAQKNANESKAQANAVSKQLKSASSKLSKDQKALKAANSKVSSAQKSVNKAQSKVDKLNKDSRSRSKHSSKGYKSWKKELDAAKKALASAKSGLSSAKNKVSSLTKSVDNGKANVNSLKGTLTNLNNDTSSYMSQVDNLNSNISDCDKTIQENTDAMNAELAEQARIKEYTAKNREIMYQRLTEAQNALNGVYTDTAKRMITDLNHIYSENDASINKSVKAIMGNSALLQNFGVLGSISISLATLNDNLGSVIEDLETRINADVENNDTESLYKDANEWIDKSEQQRQATYEANQTSQAMKEAANSMSTQERIAMAIELFTKKIKDNETKISKAYESFNKAYADKDTSGLDKWRKTIDTLKSIQDDLKHKLDDANDLNGKIVSYGQNGLPTSIIDSAKTTLTEAIDAGASTLNSMTGTTTGGGGDTYNNNYNFGGIVVEAEIIAKPAMTTSEIMTAVKTEVESALKRKLKDLKI